MIIYFQNQQYWSPRYQKVSLPKIGSLYPYYVCDISDNRLNATTDTNTNHTVDIAPLNVTLSVPPEVFNVSVDDEVGYVLTFYSMPSLFQLKVPERVNKSDHDFVADSAVLGLTINRDPMELNNLTQPVIITLQSLRAIRGQVCVSILL
jgi:hypothetical protein